MHILHLDRSSLLKFLPRNCNVAEIGVAEGDYSQEILTQCIPRRLLLIDPWEFQANEEYLADPNNVTQEQGDERAASVARRFAREMIMGTVVVDRTYSLDAATRVPDGSLDWIYLDAMHTYDAVFEDLRAWAPKVKADGLILGHDYANHPLAQQMQFGVVEAVNQFVRESGCGFLFLTLESYPTYVLAKSTDSRSCRDIVSQILRSAPTASEISNPELLNYTQEIATFSDGHQKLFFRFG